MNLYENLLIQEENLLQAIEGDCSFDTPKFVIDSLKKKLKEVQNWIHIENMKIWDEPVF